jgi:hypothetical protein
MTPRLAVPTALAALVAFTGAARAVGVAFAPTSLTLTKDDTTPRTVRIYVKGLTDGKALAFASFATLWNRQLLSVTTPAWNAGVLDTSGVATFTEKGAVFSAARVTATGAAQSGVALLTLSVTPKPGKVGQCSLRFSPSAPLNVLHDRTGLPIPISSWPSLPVTITDGGAAGAQLARSLSVSSVPGRGATIAYTLAADAAVTVEVRNVAGRLVRTLFAARAETAGPQTYTWPLLTDQGLSAPPGPYLAVVTALAPDGRQQRLTVPFTVER